MSFSVLLNHMTIGSFQFILSAISRCFLLVRFHYSSIHQLDEKGHLLELCILHSERMRILRFLPLRKHQRQANFEAKFLRDVDFRCHGWADWQDGIHPLSPSCVRQPDLAGLDYERATQKTPIAEIHLARCWCTKHLSNPGCGQFWHQMGWLTGRRPPLSRPRQPGFGWRPDTDI